MNKSGIIIVVVLAGILAGCQKVQAKNHVCSKTHCVEIEVVEKGEELQRGLQFRKSLPTDAGMLFVFKTSRPYSFWMKDTLIPLDMIWLDYARRIVYIAHNVPPCKADPCPLYTPDKQAMYVLEVNANQCERLGFKEGEEVEFRLLGL